jgi:threonine/homoserine/homoserine lactone efflux protein
MKLLPSIESPDMYGWIVLLIMLAVAILSALVVYICSILFPKKRRRRRRNSPADPAVAGTNGAPSALHRENAQGEPRS